MPPFLGQAWLDLLAEHGAALPERPGVSARVQTVVTGAPDGEVVYSRRFDDGRITSVVAGPDAEATVVLTQKYADAVDIACGRLDESTAFMQGRIKMTGDVGALMAVLPVLQSAEHRQLVDALAAQTDV